MNPRHVVLGGRMPTGGNLCFFPALIKGRAMRRGKPVTEQLGTMGERLREMRKRRRMTQVELGKLSGVTQPMISEIERGYDNPPLQDILALARVLDLSVDWLLGHRPKQPVKIIDTLAALCPQDLDIAMRILEMMVRQAGEKDVGKRKKA